MTTSERVRDWFHLLPFRISTKLAALFLVCATLAFGVYTTLLVHEEISRMNGVARQDLALTARVLAPLVSRAVVEGGERRALDLLAVVGDAEPALNLRLVSTREGQLSPASVDSVVVAVPLSDSDFALEISRALPDTRRALERELAFPIAAALILTLVSCALAVWLARALIGDPLARIVLHARRIGSGRLDDRMPVRGSDEIAHLKREINAMCERLSGAHDELARATRAKLAAVEQLRHADRLKTVGTLASGIAHELGTPLNVVYLRAKLLAKTPPAVDTAGVRESAGIILEQIERVTQIVRQLLDFARERRPARDRVDLARIAERITQMLSVYADKKGCMIEPVLSQATSSAVGDAVQIEQVVTNFVVNAVDASPAGARIRIVTGRKEDGAAMLAFISVNDEGAGIAPDVLPHVFEPFFTTKDVGQGTGLGLAVAHGIARDHGGRIHVVSEVGRGSTFTLLLPATAR